MNPEPCTPNAFFTTDPYQQYAAIYDLAGQACWSVQLAELALRAAPALGTALDAGCGTGTAACTLAAAGYRVTALDRSAAMLTIAAQRIADSHTQIVPLLGDFREHGGLPAPFDLVICADTINEQTTEHDLEHSLVGFAQMLSSSGVLIFDTLMPIRYPRRSEQTRVLHDSGMCMLYEQWRLTQRDQAVIRRLAWFVREITRWWRNETTQVLRLWRLREITAALHTAGLTIRQRIRYMQQGRVVWIVQKTV